MRSYKVNDVSTDIPPIYLQLWGEDCAGLQLIGLVDPSPFRVWRSSGWKVRFAMVVTVIWCATIYYMTKGNYGTRWPRSYQNIRGRCTPGVVASRAAAVISNYSNGHPVFLQLSEYFWVTKQSNLSLPCGTKGSEDTIMQVLAVTNYYHLPQEIERLQCKRCVVVGNGYRMKDSVLGDIINTYDIVIRMNDAPVHKYEKDVGSKTTLRFFYPESAFSDPALDNNPDTLMVLVPFKNNDVLWMKTIINDEKRLKQGFWRNPPIEWNVNPQNIRILDPYFMEFAATNLLGENKKTKNPKAKPTTGFMAISFAIHFCDMVHIAGFGYPDLNDTQPFHYYDNSSIKISKDSGHKVPLEAIAIRNLLQHHVIQNLTYF
ncbi:PREDICTED: CMP-N-acetylneuraminate-beta-galactosamide-alpha-2,3-sialyltransferase 4-like [Nanorana parkeri]|uniref:CMP-N-acetylneuraminate-beta-galactosamide- alpha-2,3-sialyltransferase 4-like n=1 Tax=Nanorana parkeri TaxID=125878 RepID=UPI0008540211|nr:PREDICTED: CMP-N-acetylneuraminate-beta-galactosamide-alpha-2,3-sialyltransferase 4-like [Nanorana parkeri]